MVPCHVKLEAGTFLSGRHHGAVRFVTECIRACTPASPVTVSGSIKKLVSKQNVSASHDDKLLSINLA